jgi:hypothetical protein
LSFDHYREEAAVSPARTNLMLSSVIDNLARDLDRAAGAMVDLGPEERERALARLRRLSADLNMLVGELEKSALVAEPCEPH